MIKNNEDIIAKKVIFRILVLIILILVVKVTNIKSLMEFYEPILNTNKSLEKEPYVARWNFHVEIIY